jgi:hypothetical protein
VGTGTQWSSADWFNAINTAALTWYGAYETQGASVTPQLQGGQQGMTVAQGPSGVYATVSPMVLIVGALGIVALVYVLKK